MVGSAGPEEVVAGKISPENIRLKVARACTARVNRFPLSEWFIECSLCHGSSKISTDLRWKLRSKRLFGAPFPKYRHLHRVLSDAGRVCVFHEAIVAKNSKRDDHEAFCGESFYEPANLLIAISPWIDLYRQIPFHRVTASKKSGKKKFKPLPPVELTPEQTRMFQKQDFIGLEYDRFARIRRLRERTPEQEKSLVEHDKDEKLIRDRPQDALREAHQAIDRGSSLLLKLIRSRALRQDDLHEQEEYDFSHDGAFDCLSSRIDYLNRQLVRLAEENTPQACTSLWFQAKALAEATMRLTLVHPRQFRSVAETSLTMPSIRTRNPKFTADAAMIADAIHLGEKHPAPDITDNRSRAGAFSHHLVARIFDDIHWYRKEYGFEVRSLKNLQKFSESAGQYEGVTIEQFVGRYMHPSRAEIILRCATLPDWPDGQDAWWEQGMLPLVRKEFDLLADDPKRNPGLWEELRKGGERYTSKDARRYLEKLCHNKFLQLLKRCP